MRHKANHFLNISSSAVKLIEFAISLLNEKLKSRIFVSTFFYKRYFLSKSFTITDP